MQDSRSRRWGCSRERRRRRGPRRTRIDDAGMVVAEAALVIPVLAVVAFVLAWAVSVTGTWLTLADATRQAARDVARGVSVDEALLAAQSRAPEAELSIDEVGSEVSVTAEQQVAPPVPLLSGWRFPLRQSVVIPREWR